jgi:riboflavin synthase
VFTGLIESLGTVRHAERRGSALHLAIAADRFSRRATVGESVAVNGCCLTLVAIEADAASFDVGDETLRRTNLFGLQAGMRVNLEWATTVGSPLGGHWVSGHIDTVGILVERKDSAEWSHYRFRIPQRWTRQLASKGSVAVDGVSLTLVDVDDEGFSVMLIPHTLGNTTLGDLSIGGSVNIETDVLAKYVERQLQAAGLVRAPSE